MTYLIKKLTPLTCNEIGKIFGIGFSAVSKAALSVEKEILLNKLLDQGINSIISNFEG